jgi:hypothetical protein
MTGHPVRSQYAKPGAPRSLIPDAILVAPATYNTINKWALGISDTYALGVLAETTGIGVPTIVLPFVNSALARRAAFHLRSADPDWFRDTDRDERAGQGGGAGDGEPDAIVTRFAYQEPFRKEC